MVRWIVGQILQSLVRGQLAAGRHEQPEESEHRTRSTSAGHHTSEVASTERERYALAVVAPNKEESAGIIDRMKSVVSTRAAGFDVRTGRLAGRRVAVAIVGPDFDHTSRITEALITAYHPQLIAAAGFVTSLADKLVPGDIVIANRIVGTDGQRVLLDIRAQSGGGLHIGTLLTLDEERSIQSAVAASTTTPAALAADRIALQVARTCQRESVPMMAIGAVTASAADHPAEISHLFRQKSWAGKAGALLGGIARRPSTAKDLWKMKESAWQASDQLATVLIDILSR